MNPGRTLGFDFMSGINLPGVFFVASMVSFGYNLVPRYFENVCGKMPNDGQIIRKILAMKKPAIEALPVYYYLYEGSECHKRKQEQMAKEWFERGLALFPNNVTLLDRRAAVLTYQKQFSEAREIFLQLLNLPDVDIYHRCYFANNLAWVDTLIGGDELIQEADKYSAEALDNMPHVSYFKGTRGAVLVETGRFDEGLKLLKEAMESAMDSTSKALDACHISIAEHRRGNLEEGQKYAAIARSLDSDCILLDRLPEARAPQPGRDRLSFWRRIFNQQRNARLLPSIQGDVNRVKAWFLKPKLLDGEDEILGHEVRLLRQGHADWQINRRHERLAVRVHEIKPQMPRPLLLAAERRAQGDGTHGVDEWKLRREDRVKGAQQIQLAMGVRGGVAKHGDLNIHQGAMKQELCPMARISFPADFAFMRGA